MKSTISILEYALEMERNGELFYKDAARRTENPQGKSVLMSLAEMEVEHQDFIKQQLDSLSNNKKWVPIPDDTSYRFEKRSSEVDKESDKASLTDISIYRMAYLIENDLMQLYKKLADQVDDEDGKKICLELAKWEEEHLSMLHDAYKDKMHDNWLDNNFYPF